MQLLCDTYQNASRAMYRVKKKNEHIRLRMYVLDQTEILSRISVCDLYSHAKFHAKVSRHTFDRLAQLLLPHPM